MTNDGIPLSKAPEHCFDRGKWAAFIGECSTREQALHALAPEDGCFVWLRRTAAGGIGQVAAEAGRDEQLAETALAFVAAFRARIGAGELALTGLHPNSLQRVPISAELCPELVLDFVNDAAQWGDIKFARVRVCESADSQGKARDLVQECVDWLRQRASGGREAVKKSLLAEAKDRFGSTLTHRDFDAAYKQVFARTLGRPPRRPR